MKQSFIFSKNGGIKWNGAALHRLIMKRIIFLAILFCVTANAQTPDNHWVFGYFGHIDFDGGVPNDVGGGPVDSDEASGTISDSNGDLLFSTNGIVVYDRNGNIMPNGTGLKGHWSSTQNVVIVPFPGDTEERFYYIFTVGAQLGIWNDSGNGLEYVIVDMLQNEGLGDVIQASQELIPNTSEKIHATYQSNNRDVWVVAHEMGSNSYYSFLVTCEGIQEPIESQSGSVHIMDETAGGAVGTMKISHNGPAIAATFNTLQPTGELAANHLDIGTFNHETGEVTITEMIVKPSVGFGTQGYGLEFSPDNSKLYWTILGGGGGILQYDLNTSPTVMTEYLVSNASPAAAGMQLAPDGSIYIAHSGGPNYLSRIPNPDDVGADVVVEVGIAIVNQSKLGLPNNWMYPYPPLEQFEESQTETLQICPNSMVTLDPEIASATSYLWSTGETSPTIDVNQPGTYSLIYIVACHSYAYIFDVSPASTPTFELSPSMEICEGETAILTVETAFDVEWFNGLTEHTIQVNRAGLYVVTISNGKCQAMATITVSEKPLPQLSLNAFYEKCKGKTINLQPDYAHADNLYLNGLETELPFVLSEAGNYTIAADNACGSIQKTLILEEVSCTCDIFVPNAFTPDGDGLNDMVKPIADCPITSYKFQIFDRWGAIVFQSTDVNVGWNGSSNNNGYYLPNGIYAYRLNWEANRLGEKTLEENSGHITLIR